MNVEILNELVTIKWILVGLVGLILIFSFFIVVIILVNKRTMGSSIELQMRDHLIAEAQMHESKGANNKFLETSEKLIELYPSDVLALWYYALANYKNNHLGNALSALADIKQIDAAWSSEAVDDYISTIKSEMNGPKSV